MIPLVVVLNALMPDLYDQGNFSHAISTGTPRDEGSKQSSSQPPCFLSVVNLTTCAGFLPNQSSTKANPLALLGTMCASLFRQNLPEDADDDVFGLFFLERYIAVHVNSWSAKQDVLALMSRKLHSFVHAKCCEDNMIQSAKGQHARTHSKRLYQREDGRHSWTINSSYIGNKGSYTSS